MKDILNFSEIVKKRKVLRSRYLWFTSWGKFLKRKRNFKNKIILDFGCDIKSNAYKQYLKQNKNNKNYYGFDLSKMAVLWLKQEKHFYDFWEENNLQFDAINASQVYEHLTKNEREAFLKRSYNLLKPGGILYLDMPYLGNLNIIEFFRRDRNHEVVACEDEAIYIESFGFKTELYVGGYTVAYQSKVYNLYRVITNLLLGYKPFLVTFIIAKKQK